MNKAAMTENEARFSRALQGAFMQPELRAVYDNLGNLEPATSQTLDGTIDIPSTLDFYAKLMIQAMKIPEGVPKLTTQDMAWTKDEFKQSWRKQNTQTSCESSQLPFPPHSKHLSQAANGSRYDTAHHPIQNGVCPNTMGTHEGF